MDTITQTLGQCLNNMKAAVGCSNSTPTKDPSAINLTDPQLLQNIKNGVVAKATVVNMLKMQVQDYTKLINTAKTTSEDADMPDFIKAVALENIARYEQVIHRTLALLGNI